MFLLWWCHNRDPPQPPSSSTCDYRSTLHNQALKLLSAAPSFLVLSLVSKLIMDRSGNSSQDTTFIFAYQLHISGLAFLHYITASIHPVRRSWSTSDPVLTEGQSSSVFLLSCFPDYFLWHWRPRCNNNIPMNEFFLQVRTGSPEDKQTQTLMRAGSREAKYCWNKSINLME